MKQSELKQLEALARHLEEKNDGYTCRVLNDGSIACMFDLLFSRAIVLGVHSMGYETRYCFESKRVAAFKFAQLRTRHEKLDGYVAKRGGPAK